MITRVKVPKNDYKNKISPDMIEKIPYLNHDHNNMIA